MAPQRWLSATACLVLVAGPVFADEEECAVEFTFDSSHAALLLEILEDEKLTDAELTTFLEHPRTEDVLKKTRSYGLEVDRSDLGAQIRQLANGEVITDRSFGLSRYEANLAGTRSLVNGLEEQFPTVRSSICDRMASFVPAGGKTFQQEVVVLSAVNSSGFTFDDPGQLYLVAEAFNGDLWGFADLVVHESYHAIQARLVKGNPLYAEDTGLSTTHENAMKLLAGTIYEGTATHMADPIAAGNEGAMRSFQYRLASRYRRDMSHQFALFDTALFRAYYDPDVDYYSIHKIGLEGNEAFYHLGALMTKTIAEADGARTIPGYFQGSPVTFFKRYVELAARDDSLPGFSSSTVKILKELDQD